MEPDFHSDAQTPRRIRVRRLNLNDFRSYPSLDLELSSPRIVLMGENGAGKTNVLEALSLLAPGRGLRRAEFADCAREGGAGGWAISAEIEEAGARRRLGTGLPSGAPQSGQRKNRIDRAPVSSSGAFSDYVRIVWLTPEMDGLFCGSPGDRRRFLDRLVLAVDPSHAKRVSAFERAARSRNRLLEEGSRDPGWLDALEREIAELAVAVAAARFETATRLSADASRPSRQDSIFPWADVALTGDLEELLPDRPALEIEDRYRAALLAGRERDAAARRTASGLRPADLRVRHGPKQIEAARCSTGEQKALLVGLVLAHAHLVARASGMAPLVLLDEIAAHFDPGRRAALFSDLADLGSQVWMTGADPQAFAQLDAGTEFFIVRPGAIEPRSAIPRGPDERPASLENQA
ncbi:MAG TPA: DNA replication/repair protein RecF [Beijerinckiaceae bacterium]|nr:DNA replication/repair protein RecF [Beijerinckiaceae bacterium]